MELIDQIRGISDELGSRDTGAPPGGVDVTEPETGEPAAPPSRGVPWYGRVFKTKAGLARELAARGYRGKRSPAAAFREWARLHPGAAPKLGGKVPKPGKPARPAHASPKSSRTNRAPAKKGAGAGGARPRTQPKASAHHQPAKPRQSAPRHQPAKPKKRGRR